MRHVLLQKLWLQELDEGSTDACLCSRSRGLKEQNSHKIALEEVLQLCLGCRIGQVANVQAAAFSSAGGGSLVGGSLVVSRGADCGVAQSGGNVVDGGIGGGSLVGGRGGSSRHFGGDVRCVFAGMTFEERRSED